MFEDFAEIEYVISNCANTFTEQSNRYKLISIPDEKIHDEDTQVSCKVVEVIFTQLSNSFKKWGKCSRILWILIHSSYHKSGWISKDSILHVT